MKKKNKKIVWWIVGILTLLIFLNAQGIIDINLFSVSPGSPYMGGSGGGGFG